MSQTVERLEPFDSEMSRESWNLLQSEWTLPVDDACLTG
jgi:hypothetical protein